MQLAVSIFITIIVIYVWIWILNEVFPDKKSKYWVSIKILFVSLLLVSGLFFYKTILWRFGLSELYLNNNITDKSIWLFILYCMAFLVFIWIFSGNIGKKNFLNTLWVGLVVFAGIGYGGYLTGINMIVMYYLLAAYAEEILKFGNGDSSFLGLKRNNKSDLVFFCILAGLGFSIIENLLYLWVGFLNQWVSLVWLSIWRWIFGSLLHVVTTGLVALVVMKSLGEHRWKFILSMIAWILVWFWVHALYNLSIVNWWKFVTIPLIIISFFVLSYLLFKSDLLFERK